MVHARAQHAHWAVAQRDRGRTGGRQVVGAVGHVEGSTETNERQISSVERPR